MPASLALFRRVRLAKALQNQFQVVWGPKRIKAVAHLVCVLP